MRHKPKAEVRSKGPTTNNLLKFRLIYQHGSRRYLYFRKEKLESPRHFFLVTTIYIFISYNHYISIIIVL